MSNESEYLNDDPQPPDQIQLVLLAACLVLAFVLAAQKWYLAPRVAEMTDDFGGELSAVTRLVVKSPRILAIPVLCAGILTSVLGLISRKVGVVVLISILFLNVALFFVIAMPVFSLQIELA